MRLELRKTKKEYLVHQSFYRFDRQPFSVTICSPHVRVHEDMHVRLHSLAGCNTIGDLGAFHLTFEHTASVFRHGDSCTFGHVVHLKHFKLKEGCSQHRRDADEEQWEKKRLNNYTIKQKRGHKLGF